MYCEILEKKAIIISIGISAIFNIKKVLQKKGVFFNAEFISKNIFLEILFFKVFKVDFLNDFI